MPLHFPGSQAWEHLFIVVCWLQVYGIVSCQLALTAVVAAIIMFNRPVQEFMLRSVAFKIINTIIPFVGALCCLLCCSVLPLFRSCIS